MLRDFDVIVGVPDIKEAVDLARSRGQKAMRDAARKERELNAVAKESLERVAFSKKI